MIASGLFSVNTFDKHSLRKAKELGLGLEVEEYLWIYDEKEISEKRHLVRNLMEGFSEFSFHGTAVNRDVTRINELSDDELLSLYNQSYGYSRFHGIKKIVFHSNYLADFQARDMWLRNKAKFWKSFLEDKPADFAVYVENFIDDTPELLAELHDAVGDSRLKICLDTGHACCNSSIDLSEWIKRLGKRIEHVHLHNNDGISDKHWPLGKGVLDMACVMDDLLTYSNVQTFVLECDFDDSLRWLARNGLLSGT